MATGFISLFRAKYDVQEASSDLAVQIAVNRQVPLKQIRVVDLSNTELESAGLPNEIVQTCPNVRELEISGTKISDWGELLNIVSQLRVVLIQALEFLGISGLPLRSETITHSARVFPSVKTLVIGESHFSDESAVVVADTFPQVGNLVWANSLLPSLTSLFPGKFAAIEAINLSHCEVTAWEQIVCLGQVPTLRGLKLCNNPIAEIPEFSAELFPALTQLNLEETGIATLQSLHHLNCFPSLTDLRINSTPLTRRFEDKSRMMLISYLPKVVSLNGSKMASKERLHSERNFIRDFSVASGSEQHAELSAAEDANPMVRLLAPEELPTNICVFQRLFDSHGKVYKFAEVNLAPPTEATLHLQTEEGEQTTATFSLQAKVRDLKVTCESMFGIPVSNMKLFWGDHEMMQVMGLEVLRFDSKTLGSYNMKDDDIIIVARKDAGA